MQHAQNHWHGLATAATVIALLGASCGGGGDGDVLDSDISADRPTTTVPEATTTTAPSETTTTTAAPTPEEEVLAAYAGYWDAVIEAFNPPEVRPELPALRQYATGEVLLGIVDKAEEIRAEGNVTRLPANSRYVHRADVVALDGNTATVRDCNLDDVVVENANTGEIVDDAVSTRLYISMLVREEGQWKVAVLNQEGFWEGEAGCALE